MKVVKIAPIKPLPRFEISLSWDEAQVLVAQLGACSEYNELRRQLKDLMGDL